MEGHSHWWGEGGSSDGWATVELQESASVEQRLVK